MNTQTQATNGVDKVPAVAKAKVAKAKRSAKPKAKKAKAATPVRKAKKARKGNRGGGKALSDFRNTDILKILKGKEIARGECFRNGQTVAQCIQAQGKAGYRGRRKYVRKQIALGRISLKRK
jgi:hypothetical protein